MAGSELPEAAACPVFTGVAGTGSDCARGLALGAAVVVSMGAVVVGSDIALGGAAGSAFPVFTGVADAVTGGATASELAGGAAATVVALRSCVLLSF